MCFSHFAGCLVMVTSVNNLANKTKYIPIALLLKKSRVASQSDTKQNTLKLLKIRIVANLIVA